MRHPYAIALRWPMCTIHLFVVLCALRSKQVGEGTTVAGMWDRENGVHYQPAGNDTVAMQDVPEQLGPGGVAQKGAGKPLVGGREIYGPPPPPPGAGAGACAAHVCVC